MKQKKRKEKEEEEEAAVMPLEDFAGLF
jgi:hypothetical protein